MLIINGNKVTYINDEGQSITATIIDGRVVESLTQADIDKLVSEMAV